MESKEPRVSLAWLTSTKTSSARPPGPQYVFGRKPFEPPTTWFPLNASQVTQVNSFLFTEKKGGKEQEQQENS